jgi:putative tryptophan/tyrosine transport system substrate-binding protein
VAGASGLGQEETWSTPTYPGAGAISFPYNLGRARLPPSVRGTSNATAGVHRGVAGAAAAWPLAARAQQGDRVRRIGVLMAPDENDPEAKRRYSAFPRTLADMGWTDGHNVRMDLRWAGDDNNRMRALAQELVGLQPDIVVTSNTPTTVAAQRETRTIPIVFAGVVDPVASGIVERLDHPTGNVTCFASLEAPLGGKWLELLSEIAPGLKRAAIMFNPDTSPASLFVPLLELAARSLRANQCARS